MLGSEVAMEIRVNGQRYKSWDRIPIEVRRELVDSGVFQDGDGSGVPDDLLPTAGGPGIMTPRYALTINGVSYGPGKPVPALLASVVHSLGGHGDTRAPFQRPRQRTARTGSGTQARGDRPAAPSGASDQSRPTRRQAPAPSGQVHRRAQAGSTPARPTPSSAAPRWDTPAVTSWQRPAGSERPAAATPDAVRKRAAPPAYSNWVGASRTAQPGGASREPDVIVETRGIPRAAVLAGLVALAVLVIVLLAVTGT
jgi:hypothetical protein